MKIRLVTVVWGDFFVDIFLRVTVRSLLAQGNAADLAKRHSVLYTIQTTADGMRKLEASPAFRQLAAAVPINFQIFDPDELDPNDLAQHWYFWRQVADVARPNHEILFFIIPDMLFGAGTLVRWAGFFEEGRHAVWTSVPQVVLETAIEEIEETFPLADDPVLSMDLAELHQFFLRQMHPYMITMFRDGRRWLRHPEIVFTAVKDEGLAMRAICSHLFCVDLNHFTLTDAFSPVDRLEDIAYDQSSHGVCLERMMKHTDLYYRPNQMDADRLSNMGKWLDDFCTPADMLESYHTYRFCASGLSDRKKFDRAAASLGFYACQVRLTGSIYRMARAIRNAGCTLGARIVAAAHYGARLRRHWRIKGEATLFVPADAAIEAARPSFRDLLASGAEKLLIDTVLAHVTPGKLTLSVGDRIVRQPSGLVSSLGTAAGKGFFVAQQGPGAQILAGPIEVDDCFIYVIDRPLKWPKPSAAQRTLPSALPNRWASSPRRVMTPVVLPAAPEGPTMRSALFSGDVTTAAKAVIRRIPGARGVAYKVLAGIKLARHPRSTLKRVVASARYRAGRVRQTLLGGTKAKVRAAVGTAYKGAVRVPGLGRLARHARDFYYAKRQAWELARRVVDVETVQDILGTEVTGNWDIASKLPVSTKTDPSEPELSMVALEGLYDVQAAQAVLNLADLLRFYKAKVGDLVPRYPPLEAVEKCLEQSGITDARLIAELRSVLEVQPNFAEAWLELGYAYYNNGYLLAAEQCWAECIASTDYIAAPVDRVGCKPLAAFARGKALEARGRLAAAIDAYAQAVAFDPRMKMAHLACAKALRKLGRIDEALVQFEASLDTDGTAAPFGKLPRTFEALSSRLAARFPKNEPVSTSRTGYAAANAGSPV